MSITGLKRHTVQLAIHNDEWQGIAGNIIDDLKTAAGNLIYDIEHIGSTAVKGLPAKPIIDIAIAVEAPDLIPSLKEKLTESGYIYRGDGGKNGGHLFVLESEPEVRTAHIHVVEINDIQWNNFLKFRDILRNDPEIRNRYKALKEKLSTKYPDDRRSYTEGKNDFVSEILKSND